MAVRSRTGVSTGVLLTGAAATVVLAAASTLGIAAASSAFSTRSCKVPALTGSVVHVTALDMAGMQTGMMPGHATTMRLVAAPAVVGPGTVSLLVRNAGTRTHELVVLPLTGASAAGTRTVGADGRIDEAGSLGEASRSCGAGAGDGITRGTSGWVTLHLAPGRYELVCNEKNHYARGMFTELDVS